MLAGRESVAKKRTGGPLQKSTIRYRKAVEVEAAAAETGVVAAAAVEGGVEEAAERELVGVMRVAG